jgi:hypothetical protein
VKAIFLSLNCLVLLPSLEYLPYHLGNTNNSNLPVLLLGENAAGYHFKVHLVQMIVHSLVLFDEVYLLMVCISRFSGGGNITKEK